jgi:HSP20 family protein
MAMAIARRDPFYSMFPFRSATERWFWPSYTASGPSNGATAPVDVYTEGDSYVIEMALPGLSPESVNVSVLENRVTISGEYPAAPEGRQFLFRERSGGRFERTLMLPTDVDADKAEAHYEHGLLRLVVPQAESAKPKRIALTAAAS